MRNADFKCPFQKSKDIPMKNILFLVLSCFTLTACNQNTHSPQQHTETQVKTKSILAKQTNCLADTQEILSKVDQKSSTQQLAAANSVLKKCIPELNNSQLYALLDSTNQMYTRFLSTTSGNDSLKGLNAYGYATFYPENAQDLGHGDAENIKKKLPKRDQYLMEQIDKEYIQFLDVGEGYFKLKRHPRYVADIFSPYLPEAEAVFIRRMAQDNADILYSDAAISISAKELVERGVFWEKYIANYPNSPYLADAKYLFKEYEYLIFIGSDNSNTFGFSNGHYTLTDDQTSIAIQWLAKQPHSSLANKAQNFLAFIAQDFPNIADDNYEQQYDSIKTLLNLSSPDFSKDCHSDALCSKSP